MKKTFHEFSYEDRIRIECVANLKDELLKTTNDIIKMHGEDPNMDVILAAAYYGALLDIGKEKHYETIPENVMLMLGTSL